MNQTILLTGAAGFIGSHTAEMLLKQGYHVIGIDSLNDFYDPQIKQRNLREIEQTAKAHGATFQFVHGDIRDQALLETLFDAQPIEAVVHLAAYAGVRPSIENPQLYFDVNIYGTLKLLECMKRFGVKRHVFASSSSVYGNNEKVPFAETDPVDHAISPYAASKKAGEVLCYTYHHLYQINTACLRFFTVYGERQRPDLAIHKFTKLIDQGKPIPFFGDGSMRRDHTYIEDILDGIWKSFLWTDAEVKRYDVFNLGESHTISLSELVAAISQAVGKEAIIDRQPLQPGDVFQTFADISHSRAVLGYAPKTLLPEGLAKFVAWYRGLQ